ncbi:MAG: hypothetical protein HY901_19595, partial [Deltaproteobacteria bacterium]|nr:hypothetical protein [Deltaproteobacteria bacterium]
MKRSAGEVFVKIDALEAHNFSTKLLTVWRESIGTDLLPVQERAIKEFGLLSSGKNLVVVAPTSAGKTAVAEMAAS